MRKKILIFSSLVLIICSICGYIFYQRIFSPNVSLNKPEAFLFIKTGSSINGVLDSLTKNNWLINSESFLWLSEKMKYDQKVIAGKYRIINGMNNRELLLLLRSGKQTPINVTFNNIRTKNDLVWRISSQLEADSVELISLLNDETELSQHGFTKENAVAMLIPNTYEMYWNTSAKKFIQRMNREYKTFWTEKRKARAKEIGLTPVQVSILASIVESETKKNDEKPVVAGVYINRLQKKWNLEADPTLVFALGDFTIKRVLNEHKDINSPYNTYKNAGLPPGPICIPEISSIDAVLNYTHHEYMYFCARADLSGYHAFAKDYVMHLMNARKYQAELNKRNIR